MTKEELQAAVDAIPYWYHRVSLPHGITTPGWLPIDPAAYRIPDDMTGKRILDIGCWDGFWSIEACRRGASHVLAIDNFSDRCGIVVDVDRSDRFKSLFLCVDALGFGDRVESMEADIQDRERCYEDIVGLNYDVIFCFGVLYHLRHPLLALENCRRVCRGSIHIETAILDNCRSAYNPKRVYDGSECVSEFYPHAEYGMNESNWHVGTLRYWAALVEAAGFKNIETWRLTDTPTCVAECRGFIRATV